MGNNALMYKLEKLELMAGQASMVEQGYARRGRELTLLTPLTSQYKRIEDVKDVEVGKQVLLTSGVCDYLRTSPVQEILEKGDNYVTFKTQTSIYKLTVEGKDDKGSS